MSEVRDLNQKFILQELFAACVDFLSFFHSSGFLAAKLVTNCCYIECIGSGSIDLQTCMHDIPVLC